jgi:hypothetical protein
VLHSDDIRSSVHETHGKRVAKIVKSKVRLKLGEMNSFFEALFQIQNPLSGLRLLGKTNSEFLRFWSSRSRFCTARFIGMVRSANFVFPLRMRIVRLLASNCVQRFGHHVLQNVHLSVDCCRFDFSATHGIEFLSVFTGETIYSHFAKDIYQHRNHIVLRGTTLLVNGN